MASFGSHSNPRKFSLWKSYFCQIAKVFPLESFHYTVYIWPCTCTKSCKRFESGDMTSLTRFQLTDLTWICSEVSRSSFSLVWDGASLIPRPCMFVACSTKFVQRAWAPSTRDVCCSFRHDPSTRINDVIDELVSCLPLKEAPRDHSNGSCANLPKC